MDGLSYTTVVEPAESLAGRRGSAMSGNAYFSFSKANLVGGTQDESKLGCAEKILMRKTGYVPAAVVPLHG
jgi:hypothetical protein